MKLKFVHYLQSLVLHFFIIIIILDARHPKVHWQIESAFIVHYGHNAISARKLCNCLRMHHDMVLQLVKLI